jgi:serine/threonine protein kinase/ABC-type phosphate/phosphonate transport system substrate-binding protein
MNVGHSSCPECGAELVAAGVGLVCGQCLLGSALHTGKTSVDASSAELSVLLAKPTAALGVKFHYFGDYELLEEIARGGMGVVFRARQTSLNRIVALKMIVAGQLASPAAVSRFRTEAKAAARLDHPNIVPIYEIGEHDGLHYFSMKLVDGGGLAELLRQGPLPPRRAAELIVTIAQAVHHAHERGVLHRDLKPGNILIDRAGQPNVADFGLAKVVSTDSALSATVFGTPSYAAPEQALGKSAPTAAADIYSLGVILYEMLSGRLPHQGSSALETVRKASEETPARLRDIPDVDADLEAICFQCLQSDPRRRYASALALAEDLENWRGGKTITARRSTSFTKVRRWMHRRPALASLVMLSVICASALPVLLHQIRAARDEKNDFVNSVRAEKIRELRSLRKQWIKLDIPFVSISSELRAEVWKARSSVVVPEVDPERYIVGIYAHENPVETTGQFAPFLAWMEDRLSLARSNRIRLDLRIYRDNRFARRALVHGAVDVMRLGAGPFLMAQEELAAKGGTFELLAKARPGIYPALVFARKNAGINSIADLKGRSLALGDPESTISGFHVPALLAENGLSAKDMRVEFHSSHNDAVSQVLRGKFDAGVGKPALFESRKDRGPGLVEITNVTCISMPWVARPGLRPELAALFRQNLLALNERSILEQLPDKPVEGFEPATLAEYEPMRTHRESAELFLKSAESDAAKATVSSDWRKEFP